MKRDRELHNTVASANLSGFRYVHQCLNLFDGQLFSTLSRQGKICKCRQGGLLHHSKFGKAAKRVDGFGEHVPFVATWPQGSAQCYRTISYSDIWSRYIGADIMGLKGFQCTLISHPVAFQWTDHSSHNVASRACAAWLICPYEAGRRETPST
jgi:hypothetical protein